MKVRLKRFMLAHARMVTASVAGIAIIGAIPVFMVQLSAHPDQSPIPLVNVPLSQQRAAYIGFAPPTEAELQDSTLVPATTAGAAAVKATDPDLKPLSVVLAHVTDYSAVPVSSCLCWVVSVDPSVVLFTGGYLPPGTPRPEYHAQFSVIIVDAHTGEPLYWRTGGTPPGRVTPPASAATP